MSERAPLLSVTVTNYNYARFLPTNLDSVLGQTFEDFELIVIDNASTDGSADLLREYAASDARVRPLLKDENQGAITSFRESCDVSRGRYRVQVDADDWVLSPTAFERQVALLESHPDMTFVYSPMVAIGADGVRFVHRFYDGDRTMTGAEAVPTVLTLSLGHSGLMLRLDAYHAVGGYPDGYRFYDDVMLAARLCEIGGVGYVDDELYGGRQHGGNENLLSDVVVVEEEVLRMIDEIFDGPLGPQIPDAARVRRRLRGKALTHQATLCAFDGDRRRAWKLWTQSFRRHPGETLFQRPTAGLVARTLLGQRGSELVRSRVGRLERVVRG